MDKLSPALKAEVKKKINDESVFGPIVNNVFQSADKDNSGFIDQSELKKLLTEISGMLGISPPTDKETKDELKRLDINKDGKISKEEFRKLVKELCILICDNA